MSSLWQAAAQSIERPTLREILCRPLPDRCAADRWLLRALTLFGRGQVTIVAGLEHVDRGNDPFILALNHSTRREALLVPAALMHYRGGGFIHFLADWNFRLIPGIGLLYRRAQTITITRKSARPAFLNVLKPLYREPQPPLERARARLLAGKSVGIFPEARVNRDCERLLKGRLGAACLSLETGTPVVPAGIRVRQFEAGDRSWRVALEIHIGAPLIPPQIGRERARIAQLRSWHAAIMAKIGRLSGKAWTYPEGEQGCTTRTAFGHAA